MCQSIYLSSCLFIYLCICLCVTPSISPVACLFVYTSVCVNPSISPAACLFIYTSVYVSLHLFTLSVHEVSEVSTALSPGTISNTLRFILFTQFRSSTRWHLRPGPVADPSLSPPAELKFPVIFFFMPSLSFYVNMDFVLLSKCLFCLNNLVFCILVTSFFFSISLSLSFLNYVNMHAYIFI